MIDSMGNMVHRYSRRQLRTAVHGRDVTAIQYLVNKGVDINTVISDVFCDTALSCAVKSGYLEVVEVLVEMPECRVDQRDRNKCSPIDEAIRSWMTSSSTETRHNIGKRFRIVRRLLEVGAKDLNATSLDILVFSAVKTIAGRDIVGKLVKLVCQKGSVHVKSVVLSVVISYRRTSTMVSALLLADSQPLYYLLKDPARLFMPVDNALVLIRATGDSQMLNRIECDTVGNLELVESSWSESRLVMCLLTLAGCQLQLYILNYLYSHHAGVYQWVIGYNSGPKSLLHLSRVAIRRHLEPNVIAALGRLHVLPEPLKLFLLFSDL